MMLISTVSLDQDLSSRMVCVLVTARGRSRKGQRSTLRGGFLVAKRTPSCGTHVVGPFAMVVIRYLAAFDVNDVPQNSHCNNLWSAQNVTVGRCHAMFPYRTAVPVDAEDPQTTVACEDPTSYGPEQAEAPGRQEGEATSVHCCHQLASPL
jgi:hypothetical protein